MTQLTDMLARMPDIQLVEDKNTMYIRGVEEVYVSTHPEIEDFERREMPSAELKNVVIPRYCDKVIVYDELFKRVVIRDNMSKKDYQIELISPPIDQKTIFVGEEVEEANGFTIAKTRDGGFCFVDYGDILIPPDCIDEYGRIDSGYRL